MPLGVLEQFKALYILDSSQVSLPLWVSQEFLQRRSGPAKLKFHLLFNYTQGQLAGLEVTPGLIPDQCGTLLEQDIQANSLYVFDLGYFSKHSLQVLAEHNAFFICRLQSQTALYIQNQRFDLATFAAKVDGEQACLSVQVGTDTKVNAWLWMRRVSPQLAQQRRAAAHKKARHEGYCCSASYLTLLGWDILISNVLFAEPTVVFLLYTLRWQIELLFKLCKSYLAFDHIAHWSRQRIFCQFYARLIGLVLTLALTAPVRFFPDFELSLPKAVQVLQRALSSLLSVIRSAWRGWLDWFLRLKQDFFRFAPKQKRKKSPSSYRRLASIET